MIFLTTGSEQVLDNFSFEAIKELYEVVKNLFTGVREFFISFHDVFYVLFPYFTDEQVNYFVTVITVFLGLVVYLFFRKVTI